MDIKTYTEKRQVVVSVMPGDGNIDASREQAFQSRVDELMDGDAHFMLIDLIHGPFVSSTGIRALRHVYDRLRSLYPDSDIREEEVRKGIRAGTYKSPFLKLLNPSNEAARTFEMTGFHKLIEIFTDKDTAIASFSADRCFLSLIGPGKPG